MERTVVLAEDEPHLRRIFSRRLADAGYRVVEAEDGEAARRELLALVEGGASPVAVLDVMMPRLDGLSLLRLMREDEALCAVPVIIASAVRDPAARETFEELGVATVLVKPFPYEDLLAAVERALPAPPAAAGG